MPYPLRLVKAIESDGSFILFYVPASPLYFWMLLIIEHERLAFGAEIISSAVSYVRLSV